MRIALYAPLKPLDHPVASGDRTIARGIRAFLQSRGHEVLTPSRFRARWIFRKPWLWPMAAIERPLATDFCRRHEVDLWLTYHSYYKAPDVIGPAVCEKLGLPYAIFQGVYSTKRRKKLATRLGFELNTRALKRADVVFTNKRVDLKNLKRLLPENRLKYIRPGLDPSMFSPDPAVRHRVRRRLKLSDPVVMSAAMFRPGVKRLSLMALVRTFALARTHAPELTLMIAGDGPCGDEIRKLARNELGSSCVFLGDVDRNELRDYYSAADIFAYPGIGESLGMVYLEAQSAGLPVVAWNERGPLETVRHGQTGLISKSGDEDALARDMAALAQDPEMRRDMGDRAMETMRLEHDVSSNYRQLEDTLRHLAAKG